MTKTILPYKNTQYITNMNFEFELNTSRNARLNRYNVLQNYNSGYDKKQNYLSALLNLIMSWAYSDGNRLISRLSGQQLEQLGNNNTQRFSIMNDGLYKLQGMNIIKNFKIING